MVYCSSLYVFFSKMTGFSSRSFPLHSPQLVPLTKHPFRSHPYHQYSLILHYFRHLFNHHLHYFPLVLSILLPPVLMKALLTCTEVLMIQMGIYYYNKVWAKCIVYLLVGLFSVFRVLGYSNCVFNYLLKLLFLRNEHQQL